MEGIAGRGTVDRRLKRRRDIPAVSRAKRRHIDCVPSCASRSATVREAMPI
jgi:hypothetical protein